MSLKIEDRYSKSGFKRGRSESLSESVEAILAVSDSAVDSECLGPIGASLVTSSFRS